VKAAVRLLQKGGREALTTRSVSEAADVQPPTLYRLFGDMRGLLDAVAEHGLAAGFNRKKQYKASSDPVEDLRNIWMLQAQFGVENPELYALILGEPRPGFTSPAAEESKRMLSELIHRIAMAGRLKVTEKRAAELVHALSSGTVLALLNTPENERDFNLAKDACEAVIKSITTEPPTRKKPGAESAAIALKASLGHAKCLSPGERMLLEELLDRLASS
jgi:AcrR family transcriptional regulator